MQEENAPILYRLVRWIFYLSAKVFYNTIEVQGKENIPKSTECTILCPNHGNSLVDAIIVVSQTPRMVRLTAKDTLFERKDIFGFCVKSVGTIPIQRRDEHGEKVDNRVAMKKVYTSLEAGSCVCLFPEGISRYQSGLAPLKNGVGRIALEVMKRNLKIPGFKVNIVSCGITYLHREKFRSDVSVQFCEPIVIDRTKYEELMEKSHQDPTQMLMRKVATQLREHTITASNWVILSVAHTARRLYAPLGTRISLKQHIFLTQQFINLFSSTLTAASQGGRTGSDAEFVDPNTLTVEGIRTQELTQAICSLEKYQRQLDYYGIKDERVRRSTAPISTIALCFIGRSLWATVLFIISLPGALVLAPLFAVCRWKEYDLQKKNTSSRLVKNMDEVAQYKLAYSVLLTPVLMTLSVLLADRFGIVSWKSGTFILPAATWLSIRTLEDCFACVRSCMSLAKLVLLKKEIKLLKTQREKLEEIISLFGEKMNLPTTAELLEDAPPHIQERNNFRSYFSIKRRRKKDWGEIMRLSDIDAPYPVHVLRKRSQDVEF